MRAIAIKFGKVEEIELPEDEVNHPGAIKQVIDCLTYTSAGFADDYRHLALVDDEGLLKGADGIASFLTEVSWYEQPLAGNIVLIGVEDDGGTVPATLTLEEVGGMIEDQYLINA